MAKKEHSYNSGRIYRANQNGNGGGSSSRSASRGRNASFEGQTSRSAQQGRAQTNHAQASRQPQKMTYAGGRHTTQQARSGARGGSAVRSRKKPLWPKIVIPLVLVVVALGIVFAVFYNKVDNAFAVKENVGKIEKKENLNRLYDKSDVLNFLVIGIDYEEGREYADQLGMTDMIMYINFDVKNNQLNMLQIPRDSYVGLEASPDGKINSVLANGPNKEAPINNLVDVIENQFKLPVDNYLSMDMDGLRDIVDALGGVEVYVPRELNYGGSYLPQGLLNLNGEAAEFFVRVRYGEGFERADIDRLENQRYFYAAFFRRLMSVGASDMLNLLPIFEKYVSTDFSEGDVLALINSMKVVGSEGMMFCRVPGATSVDGLWSTDPPNVMYIDLYGRQDPNFDKDALVEAVNSGMMTQEAMDEQVTAYEENPGVAKLLNDYFRAHSTAVPAEDLGLPQVVIPENVSLYPTGMQRMSDVSQTGEEGTEPTE